MSVVNPIPRINKELEDAYPTRLDEPMPMFRRHEPVIHGGSDADGPLMLIPGSHHWFVPCVGRTPADNWKQSLRDQQLGVPDNESLRRLIQEGGGIVAPKGGPGTLIMFECNTLHASNANLSPYPRSNLFFVYNSVENRLVAPHGGTEPRPEFLGARRNTEALQPLAKAA